MNILGIHANKLSNYTEKSYITVFCQVLPYFILIATRVMMMTSLLAQQTKQS